MNYRNVTGGGTFPRTLQREGKEARGRTEGQLIIADAPDLALTLIISGVGLGMVLEPEAAPHIAAGRLVHVLEEWCVPLGGLHPIIRAGRISGIASPRGHVEVEAAKRTTRRIERCDELITRAVAM